MKKLLPILLFLGACRPNNDGIYVAHLENRYTIADDTLIIEDTVVIIRTGYQKIRHGKFLPKQYKIKQWGLHSPDPPALLFDGDNISLGQTNYQRIK